MPVRTSLITTCAHYWPVGHSRSRLVPTRPRSLATRKLCQVQALQQQNADDGSLGNGGGGKGAQKATASKDDDPGGHAQGPWAWLVCAIIVGCVCWVNVTKRQSWEEYRDDPGRVSVIIPALNEEKCIADTIRAVQSADPLVHEIIVVDGNSQDRTRQIVASMGVQVVLSKAGRARQMNAGARAASGDLFCFLHADTQPPKELVAVVRGVMADSHTVLGGFRTIIQTNGKRLHGMTLHHLVKTYYIAATLRPWAFIRGLRCLFGDQTLFCRAADFRAVGGFTDDLPIMEDVDLSIRMHEARPALSKQALRTDRDKPGRTFMVMNPVNHTSGRRLNDWGAAKATWIHFYIALKWYFGASPDQMYRIYHQMYTDNHR